ncbi:MAG: hypothetical protein LBM25_01400 [Bacteroidales bacterium]|jgi:hypothetical protein|nr:hypothetical protein [Bacteroidales bacterium]
MESNIKDIYPSEKNPSYNEDEELMFTEIMKSHLYTYIKWSKFIATLSYIGSFLILIFGLFYILVDDSVYNSNKEQAVFIKIVIMTICFTGAILYFIMASLLFTSANNMKIGLERVDQKIFEIGTDRLARFIKFIGIITIIFIIVYILSIVAGFIATYVTQ